MNLWRDVLFRVQRARADCFLSTGSVVVKDNKVVWKFPSTVVHNNISSSNTILFTIVLYQLFSIHESIYAKQQNN